MTKTVYIIGAGGTASYLLPVLIRMLDPELVEEVIIVDRDVLEEKNVERQNFQYDDIGAAKADILAEAISPHAKVLVSAVTEWFTDQFPVKDNSFIISCTDNHPARRAVLTLCDLTNSEAVICGNETFSADAYYYSPKLLDTLADPRVRYPEILTDEQDDPTRPPCNDEAVLETNPQLASANNSSATFGIQLAMLDLSYVEALDLEEESVKGSLPIEFSSTKLGVRAVRFQDVIKKD
jgi:molybdopterin/thiamine biosynthesis adenylyltransferase